ncbi:MAG TPA: urea transporter, partial [Pseudomonadales bacterium]
IKQELKDGINGLLRAYATIVFLEKPFAGFVILAASMFFPNLGIAGLVAAVTGLVVARLLSFPYIASGMHIFNSLLVGLSLGAFYRLDMHLLLLIILGAIIAILLTVALSSALWRYDALPVLSLPFVIVAMTMAFAARSYQSLEYVAPSYTVDGAFISTSVDTFSSTLGAIYFLTHPAMGLVIFLLLLLHSRYLALLAVCGFAVGYSLLTSLTGNVYPNLAAWSGFNFALTAMAIGGVFIIPGVASFVIAMVAAAIAALLTTALQNLLLGYGLPVMAFPFLLTSLTVMAALRQRVGSRAPQMAAVPGLPETNYERARLARVRGTGPGSMALLAPFYGEWDIYQGFAGKHTHKGQWQYALDFYMLDDNRSYAGDGNRLEDFYCFGAPL